MSFEDYLKRLATQRYETSQNRISFQTAQIANTNWQSCLNCNRWNNENEICSFYNAKPPGNVIIVGCLEYKCDIPF